MKRRIHINAIENAINWLFAERINQSDIKDTDTCLDAIECIDNVNYVYRKINRRDKAELYRIAQINLEKYLSEHTDNTFDMFKQTHIEKSKYYQTYYPDYKTNNKQKEIYFDLQTWIEVLEQMTELKDTRFFLTTIDEVRQTSHEYKVYQRQIENNGCVIVKTESDTIKIYTAELAVVLASKALPARNMDTQTETAINGWEYLKTYIQAYKEGEQYFETEFKVSPNTLYGENAEQYVRDIHLNFFHVRHTGVNCGWGFVKKQYPVLLTRKEVEKYGYYSGIVNKVEEQVKKCPRLFATFDKCEHEITTEHLTQEANEKLKVVNEIVGLTGKENFNKTNPVFHYIAAVLKKHNLTHSKAAELIDEMQGAFEPTFKKNFVFPIIEYLDRQSKRFQKETGFAPQRTKTDKLKAPVLGLFCSLINKIGIDKKDETESATVYCERICRKFKLPYTDRVRQNYNVNETKRLVQELTQKVLPLIDNETKNSVEKYLDSKQPLKQNLYA